jgi:hypothetical protein
LISPILGGTSVSRKLKAECWCLITNIRSGADRRGFAVGRSPIYGAVEVLGVLKEVNSI